MRQASKSRRIGLPLLIAALLLWPDQMVAAQSSSNADGVGPIPKATLVDGQPALALDYGDGMGFLIVETEWHDRPAFRFSVLMVREKMTNHLCGGYLWVVSGDVDYMPDSAANQKICTPVSNASPPDIGPYNWFIFVYSGNARKAFGRDSRNGGREWNSAGKLANTWLELAYKNFSEAEKQFAKATTGIAVPLSPQQSALISAATQRGEASEGRGDLRTAFDAYASSLASLPPTVSSAEVDALRTRMLRLVPKLNPPPAISDDAQRYFFGSQAALQEWKDKGNATKLDDAIEQLNEALRIAPWWPQAYFNRGLLLEQRGRYAEAIESLKLYLLASPNASDAMQVKQKIYMLEYKAREAETRP